MFQQIINVESFHILILRLFRARCQNFYKENFKQSYLTRFLKKKNKKFGFYLVGEVYNYGINTGQYFDFGDKK